MNGITVHTTVAGRTLDDWRIEWCCLPLLYASMAWCAASSEDRPEPVGCVVALLLNVFLSGKDLKPYFKDKLFHFVVSSNFTSLYINYCVLNGIWVILFYKTAYIHLCSCMRLMEQERHAVLSSSHPLAEDFYLEMLIEKRYAAFVISF